MPLDFPSSPTNGQYYNGFVYNAANETWDSAYAPRAATVPISSPNYIINGAFDIWQRGTSITGTSNVYGPDRWQGYGYATNSVTLQQVAFTPGAAPSSDVEGQFHLRITSSNTKVWLTQNVENVRTLAGKTATVSFWVKSASAQTGASVYLSQYTGVGGTGSGDLAAQTFDIGTTWQRVSKTFEVPSLVGKTVGDNSRLSVTITGAINNALDVWGVQLEAGAAATDFRRNAPSIAGELAACQRYYVRRLAGSLYGTFGSGRVGSTTAAYTFFQFPVEMRIAPSSLEWTGSGSNYLMVDNTGRGVSNLSVDSSNTQGATITVTGTGYTTSAGMTLQANALSTAYIGFSAEL